MKNKLKQFKSTFYGANLLIKTYTSGTVKGYLLNKNFENKIKSINPFISDMNLNDYICILNTETENATFLLLEDIRSIDVFE